MLACSKPHPPDFAAFIRSGSAGMPGDFFLSGANMRCVPTHLRSDFYLNRRIRRASAVVRKWNERSTSRPPPCPARLLPEPHSGEKSSRTEDPMETENERL
jgi:hypothetical protein